MARKLKHRPKDLKFHNGAVQCDSCGNTTGDAPYVRHVIPTYKDILNIPIYNKRDPKTKRLDLSGSRKIQVYQYCDSECYESAKTHEV